MKAGYALNQYEQYQDYLAHQPKKAATKKVQNKLAAKREERIVWFMRHFAKLPLLGGPILCLGARYGEEVEAFWRLGFAGAVGFDLAAHPPWVRVGDMNHLTDVPDRQADIVYSNAFDHCWRPEGFAREIKRLLRPQGLAVLHINLGNPGDYETWVPDEPAEVAALFTGCIVERSDAMNPPYHGMAWELILRRCHLSEETKGQ